MALDTICPHCKQKVIESYKIINPYLYGSKIRKCPKCGGEIFDNRWREVAIQGFDPIQDTEKTYASRFGFSLVAAGLCFMNMNYKHSLGNPTMIKVGCWFALILGGFILIFYFRHLFGFVKRKNAKYMEESIERMRDPEYVSKIKAHGVTVPEEYSQSPG